MTNFLSSKTYANLRPVGKHHQQQLAQKQTQEKQLPQQQTQAEETSPVLLFIKILI